MIQSDGEVKDFESVAATIVDDPAIRNVILAPAGIVSHVYPLKGNERVLGLNYFLEGEGNREAVMAKKFGQLVLGGPFIWFREGRPWWAGSRFIWMNPTRGSNGFGGWCPSR